MCLAIRSEGEIPADLPPAWTATAAGGTSIVMRPFMKIDQESYVTYVVLKS
jgi:hypothetical protein